MKCTCYFKLLCFGNTFFFFEKLFFACNCLTCDVFLFCLHCVCFFVFLLWKYLSPTLTYFTFNNFTLRSCHAACRVFSFLYNRSHNALWHPFEDMMSCTVYSLHNCNGAKDFSCFCIEIKKCVI